MKGKVFGQFSFCLKGAVVEWLGGLGYSAENRHNVVSLRLDFAMQSLETSVNPAVNGYLFRIRKERDGLCLSSAVPKIQWAILSFKGIRKGTTPL